MPLIALAQTVTHDAAPPPPLSALLQKRLELQAQLKASTLGQPLVFQTAQVEKHISGDLYAELALPFQAVRSALASPGALCGWLFLHLNVHGCETSMAVHGVPVIKMAAASRSGLKPAAMQHMEYEFHADAGNDMQRRVQLVAAQGPMDTSDYRLVFEIAAIDTSSTFVHFSYAYRYGTLGKMAMQVYMATVAKAKLGFTVIGQDAEGKPQYLRGERASIERALMRNYLALQAYASVPERASIDPFEARLKTWFANSELHARQLHEIELDQYLDEKRKNRPR